jgi:hypothetical protein
MGYGTGLNTYFQVGFQEDGSEENKQGGFR